MSAQPARILVADDDQGLLDTVAWILRDKGYDVVPVQGGEQLLHRLEEVRPDLLLLDIMMPKIDGLQLLEQVKARGEWRDLPVLMISSMPPEDGTVRSLGLGASDFIAKPFRVKELVARVDAHLRLGRRLRDARSEAKRRATEAAIRAEMVDILHEVTDALAPDEIYNILARRVAKVLNISRCSIIMADAGDRTALVVVAADNPMLRNLEVRLERYPEIQKALRNERPVLVTEVATDPLYDAVRRDWEHEGVRVLTRSAIAVPFTLQAEQRGVFFLRTIQDEPPLTASDLEFAEQVIRTAVAAIEKAYALQSAQSDKERYERLASTDPLTGCLNRRVLIEKLEAELERADRYGLAVSVLMIDLDRFKAINDTHGHVVGDNVLRQIGELLRREARTVDLVARYGGEEFIIVLPETGINGALMFGDRIRARVAATRFADGDAPLWVTVSVGVASSPPAVPGNPETFIALADEALYRAKHGGRDTVRS